MESSCSIKANAVDDYCIFIGSDILENIPNKTNTRFMATQLDETYSESKSKCF